MADKDFKVKQGLDVGIPVPIADGGTGQTTAENALNALLPVQTSFSGNFLKTDGTNVIWSSPSLQTGTTAQRPSSPSTNDLYFNTTLNAIEVYTQGNWYLTSLPPNIPTIGTATNIGTNRPYNNGSASVAFTTPTTKGVPNSYTVISSPGGYVATGTNSPITITGLQSAISYTYTVTASNEYGTSTASSASNSVTATTVPQTISVLSSSNTANIAYESAPSQVVSWTPAATGGSAIIDYTVTPSTGSPQTVSGTTATFTGLTTGSSYTYSITARNANGSSSVSSATSSLMAATVPQAPTIGTVTYTSGNNYADISFTPGNNGNSTVTSYTVTASSGGFTGTGSSSPVRISNLTPGAYTFTVTATNAIGTSLPSSSSSSIQYSKATGGTIYTSGSYTYHVFTASGTFTPYVSLTADVLVVGGGGSSGYDWGAGGGAGGLQGFTNQSITSAKAVTVGAGAAAPTVIGNGNNGNASQFGSLTASVGGGYGGGYSNGGGSGGSGGGASGRLSTAKTGGAGTSGQGNKGGNSVYHSNGGGGGAGEAGIDGGPGEYVSGRGGNGSSAYSSWGAATGTGENISGTYWYAGGGGSGTAGGNGGGGGTNKTYNAGMANTGGGSANVTPGGSGIVIVRYLS